MIEGLGPQSGSDNLQSTEEAKTIVYRAGKAAASSGTKRPTKEMLQTRKNYTEEQIETYLKAYDKYSGDDATQAIRRASRSGLNAARSGAKERPAPETLKQKNKYTYEQVEAYLEAFDKHYRDSATQAIKRASKSGLKAAHNGTKRPTKEKLKERNQYSDEQAEAYLKAFDEYCDDAPTQAIRHGYRMGAHAARKGAKRLPKNKLKAKNNYTEEQAEAYLKAYDAHFSNEAAQAIKDSSLVVPAPSIGLLITDEALDGYFDANFNQEVFFAFQLVTQPEEQKSITNEHEENCFPELKF